MNDVIIISGASAGIGRELALQLGAGSHKLVLCARRGELLESVAQEARSAGAESVDVVAGDLTDASVRRQVVEVAQKRGGIFGLVNNAGFGQPGPAELVPEELYKRQFDVNVYAPAELIRLVAPHMREGGGGRIVNVTSILGRITIPMMGWYAASKHALESLSVAWRAELKAFGVSVSVVEPGPIATEFGQVATSAGEALGENSQAYRDHFAAYKVKYAARKQGGGAHPRATARAIVHALTARKPRLVYRTTLLTRIAATASWAFPRRVFESTVARVYGMPRKR